MLIEQVRVMLDRPVDPGFAELARRIAMECSADAVLFYGSSLRTGDREGVADFYVLRDRPGRAAKAWQWPTVSYHEIEVGGGPLRAKVASMTLREFERAATGRSIDTTVWTRFAQPARLSHFRDAGIAQRVTAAVADCIVTAARFAAALGPATGTAAAYWQALFHATYGAEFRIEKQSRAQSLLANDPAHFDQMLPLAWQRLKLLDSGRDPGTGVLEPRLTSRDRARWLRDWRRRQRVGKPLNIVRLLRAAFTFEGATRYALWKIERHSGVRIPATPWRERHPVLAAPGVLFQLWRAARQ